MKSEISLGEPSATRPRSQPRRGLWATVAAVVIVLRMDFGYLKKPHTCPHAQTLASIQQCSITNLHSNLSFLVPAHPIAESEFLHRHDELARALTHSSAQVFVMEPGYTSQYYFNLSQPDWEVWEPEERPMLMLVTPQTDASSGETVARRTILAPLFEVGRVSMLGLPGWDDGLLDVVGWEEHWDPYVTLREAGLFKGVEGDVSVMVDEEIRDFIVRGLDRSGFVTQGLGGEVEAVKQTKSAAEVELVRAVNTGTVEAVRAVRKCLVPGVTEDDVMRILDSTMSSIGFEPFFDIVLFEEDGALPHGGFVTGGKVLTEDTMVVIDVGAHYLGYSSDICRSFFIDASPSHTPSNPDLHAEKLAVWRTVLDAQTESAKQFVPNATAASVDIAARKVISDAGYGDAFTHRVGHGIGIKAHESPYLNKGNHAVKLRAGMTFTSEPGIYLLNRFGVRHEDIFLVKEDGEAEVLTGTRATSPWEP